MSLVNLAGPAEPANDPAQYNHCQTRSDNPQIEIREFQHCTQTHCHPMGISNGNLCEVCRNRWPRNRFTAGS